MVKRTETRPKLVSCQPHQVIQYTRLCRQYRRAERRPPKPKTERFRFHGRKIVVAHRKLPSRRQSTESIFPEKRADSSKRQLQIRKLIQFDCDDVRN